MFPVSSFSYDAVRFEMGFGVWMFGPTFALLLYDAIPAHRWGLVSLGVGVELAVVGMLILWWKNRPPKVNSLAVYIMSFLSGLLSWITLITFLSLPIGMPPKWFWLLLASFLITLMLRVKFGFAHRRLQRAAGVYDFQHLSWIQQQDQRKRRKNKRD